MRRLPATLLVALASLVAAPLGAGARVPPVASYRIEASVDADLKLTGTETITFVNRTARPLHDLRLHLYLNAFRNDRSTWMREGGVERRRGKDEAWFGYTNVTRLVLPDGTDLTSRVRFIQPDDGNPDDRTLAAVPLPRPVGPGETLSVELEFSARFPRGIARTGWKDGYLMAAQWYPKLSAVSDEGWLGHQFHMPTEFFADFGDYDVTLLLPGKLKGKVGGSGTLVEELEQEGGRTRVRFEAPDVHDFAFTFSPFFERHRDVFRHPELPPVELVLLLQPEHASVRDRYFRAAKEALARFGRRYVPYPYPQLTIVDPAWGSETGGMEYPNLILGGAPWLAPAGSHSPEGVTVHETGHQFFYLLLASNELEEAHLDEGLNTYATLKVLKEAFGEPPLEKRFFGVPWTFSSVRLALPLSRSERYLDWQVKSRSDAVTDPSFRQLDAAAVRVNAYNKPALVLASLEGTFGEEPVTRALRSYATRFAFRHPTTRDLLSAVREEAGAEAAALAGDAFRGTGSWDYAVTEASTKRIEPASGYTGDGLRMSFAPAMPREDSPFADRGWESTVVVRRLGEAVWPVDVELTFEGGQKVRRRWAGRDRWIRYRAYGAKLLGASVDPDGRLLLDVNRTNNGMRSTPDRRASRRWGSRLRFWAQNVLETAALLGTVVLRPAGPGVGASGAAVFRMSR